jgi:hypothetical protein
MHQTLYQKGPVFCVTSDVDWASEDAIRFQQGILDGYRVVPTYFMTHHSPVLNEWHAEGRVHLGIHPNFLPGSSHGSTFEEVIDTVLQFAPQARCFRSHHFFDTTAITHALAARGFEYDSNLCTVLQERIVPIRHESGLIRFPCFYEDGTLSWQREGWQFDDFAHLFRTPGLKIINIHPMTTALNAPNPEFWGAMKKKFAPAQWLQLTAAELSANRWLGSGPIAFLRDALTFIRANRYPLMTMEELYQNFGKALHGQPLARRSARAA